MAHGSLSADSQYPDPRKLQISLTGFLEASARPFMGELWRLLVSAQQSVGGVPRAFVEAKKLEMQQKREVNENVLEHVRQRDAPHRSVPPPREDAAETSSRWDRGAPPIGADERGDGRVRDTGDTRARRRGDDFVDKRGNVTRRERDRGWVRGRAHAMLTSRARAQRRGEEMRTNASSRRSRGGDCLVQVA